MNSFHTKLIALPQQETSKARSALRAPLRPFFAPTILYEANAIRSGTSGRLLNSHPNGFVREILPLDVVEALTYQKSVMSSQPEETLEALKILMHQIKNNRYEMPLNTARVLIALIKRTFKHQDDPESLINNLDLFKLAYQGKASVIRKLLKELQMVELPENIPLRDIGYGWDDKVYDNFSTGRKSTVQLILDAYIKGLSTLTICHTNALHMEGVDLGLRAAEMLGIDLNFCVEFSAGPAHNKMSYLLYFPECHTLEDYEHALAKKSVSDLMGVLEQHTNARNDQLRKVLQRFNIRLLPGLNAGFEDKPDLLMTPLTIAQLEQVTHHGVALSRIHAGVLFEQKFKAVCLARIDYLQFQIEARRFDVWRRSSRAELRGLRQQLRQTWADLRGFHLYEQTDRYFAKTSDYDTIIPNFREQLSALSQDGYRIVLTQTLEHGLKPTLDRILNYFPLLHGIEIYNTRINYHNPNYQQRFKFLAHIVNVINGRDYDLLRTALLSIYGREEESARVEGFIDALRHSSAHLITTFGSDTNGHNPANTPGMGFFMLNEKAPAPVSTQAVHPIGVNLIEQSRSPAARSQFEPAVHYRLELPDSLAPLPKAYEHVSHVPLQHPKEVRYQIFSMGDFESRGHLPAQPVERVPFKMVFTHPHPFIRNTLAVGAGLGLAFAFPHLSIGAYTYLWFGITFMRNFLSDMIAAKGINPLNWRLRHFDLKNATNDLFFTGGSIPLMKVADFALTHLLGPNPSVFLVFAKFLGLCMTNGLYLFTHNLLRGFPVQTARLNLFRSLIGSVPATIGYQAWGPIIPVVVQNKMWSDVVGGVIEGSMKYLHFWRDRHQDYTELFERFRTQQDLDKKKIAALDILYIWGKSMLGPSGLKRFLSTQSPADRQQFESFLRQEDLFSVFNDPSLDPRYQQSFSYLRPKMEPFTVFIQKQNSRLDHRR